MKIKDRIFAHRAGCGCFLGNTIEGIQYCIAMGLNFEIDVRACQNGLVVTHHEKLGQDYISQYPIEAVRKFGINSNDGSIVFAPATVHGRSDIARIPTLPEVLNLVAESGKEIKVILDIKKRKEELKTLERIIKSVKYYDLEKHVIIGIPQKEDTGYIKLQSEIATLLFGTIGDITNMEPNNDIINYVRVWQDWLQNNSDEITDPDYILEKMQIAKKKVIITAGGMNEIQGGEISRGQFEKLMELGVDGVIVNDPAIYL